jgi:hypothetical protein
MLRSIPLSLMSIHGLTVLLNAPAAHPAIETSPELNNRPVESILYSLAAASRTYRVPSPSASNGTGCFMGRRTNYSFSIRPDSGSARTAGRRRVVPQTIA